MTAKPSTIENHQQGDPCCYGCGAGMTGYGAGDWTSVWACGSTMSPDGTRGEQTSLCQGRLQMQAELAPEIERLRALHKEAMAFRTELVQILGERLDDQVDNRITLAVARLETEVQFLEGEVQRLESSYASARADWQLASGERHQLRSELDELRPQLAAAEATRAEIEGEHELALEQLERALRMAVRGVFLIEDGRIQDPEFIRLCQEVFENG